MHKHLHIICLNVPYPADYGGVFDLFYKLPALQKQGVKIHLHCFDYGRGVQEELNKYCESVHYYSRNMSFSALTLFYPYIVSSRINETLLQILCQDEYPVFMEGVHCTYPLNDKRFSKRKCFVRLHNVEYIYYRHLSRNTRSFFKKCYFFLESIRLKWYEKSIVNKATFWGVVEKDDDVYKSLGCKNIDLLPLFLPEWKMKSHAGNGIFCLYHGDLSIGENEKAVIWLIEKVFNNLNVNFVIAGKNPSHHLVEMVESKTTMCMIANPDEGEMQDLIQKAQLNLIPSFNSTGIKVKLINALYNGRHCIVNRATIDGTGLEELCHIANDELEFKKLITNLYQKPFNQTEIEQRQKVLLNMFNNERNAKQMVTWIWGNENS